MSDSLEGKAPGEKINARKITFRVDSKGNYTSISADQTGTITLDKNSWYGFTNYGDSVDKKFTAE